MANSTDAVCDKVKAETAHLTETYANEFRDDPEGELKAWLEIAVRREAMVRYVYGEGQREVRIPKQSTGAAKAAYDVLSEIWQQEATHTALIKNRLTDGIVSLKTPLKASFGALMGEVEGRVLGALTPQRPSLGQALAKIATSLGSAVAPAKVPAFAAELAAMHVGEFFLLAQTLELTAKQAYERMETLLESVSNELVTPSVQLAGLALALANVRREEEFHESTFRLMRGWTNEDGSFDSTLVESRCIEDIARLLPRPSFRSLHDQNKVFTTGGLDALFRRHGIELTVV